jgi:hypothetical protein
MLVVVNTVEASALSALNGGCVSGRGEAYDGRPVEETERMIPFEQLR